MGRFSGAFRFITHPTDPAVHTDLAHEAAEDRWLLR